MSKEYWKELLHVSDRIAEKIEAKVWKYYELLDRQLPIQKIEQMMRDKLLSIEGEIDWRVIEELDLSKEIEEAVLEGGLIGRDLLRDLKIIAHFNIKNPAVVEYIKAHVAELVTNVTEETKEAIREIVLQAYEEGGHPYEQAKKIKEIIGLDTRRAKALENYRKSLEEAGARDIEKKVERYRQQLLRDRAKMIARNESIKAVNEGQRHAWLQAKEAGLLRETEFERVWIVTPDDRLCDLCRVMSGERAPITGTYRGGIVGPPLHIACRCTEGIVRKKLI